MHVRSLNLTWKGHESKLAQTQNGLAIFVRYIICIPCVFGLQPNGWFFKIRDLTNLEFWNDGRFGSNHEGNRRNRGFHISTSGLMQPFYTEDAGALRTLSLSVLSLAWGWIYALCLFTSLGTSSYRLEPKKHKERKIHCILVLLVIRQIFPIIQ